MKRGILVAVACIGGWFAWRWWNSASYDSDPTNWTIDYARKEGTVDALTTPIRFEKDPAVKNKLIDAFRDDFTRLHDAARAHLTSGKATRPHGLDAILAGLRDAGGSRLAFHGTPTIELDAFAEASAGLAQPGATVATVDRDTFKAFGCAAGFSDAFKAALGSEVISFDAGEVDPLPPPVVTATYTMRPSGSGYVVQNGRRVFPGIAITGSVTFGDVTVSMDATPPSNLEFTTDAMSGAFEGGQDGDIAYALLRATCAEAGYRVVEKMTGWVRPDATPKAATPEDAIAACKQKPTAKDCLAAGDALEPTDALAAEHAYSQGCDATGLDADEACVKFADLALARAPTLKKTPLADPGLDLTFKARFAAERACHAHYGAGCLRRGSMVRDHEPQEAFDFFVRACDLGDARGCDLAVAMVGQTGLFDSPYPPAAAGLRARSCWLSHTKCAPEPKHAKTAMKVREVAVGDDVPFDVRWEDWLDLDQGHAAMWIASAQASDAVYTKLGAEIGHGTARVYERAEVPYGIEPPAGAKTVWAIYLSSASAMPEEPRCRECTGDPQPQLYVGGCTCLPLKSVEPTTR